MAKNLKEIASLSVCLSVCKPQVFSGSKWIKVNILYTDNIPEPHTSHHPSTHLILLKTAPQKQLLIDFFIKTNILVQMERELSSD